MAPPPKLNEGAVEIDALGAAKLSPLVWLAVLVRDEPRLKPDPPKPLLVELAPKLSPVGPAEEAPAPPPKLNDGAFVGAAELDAGVLVRFSPLLWLEVLARPELKLKAEPPKPVVGAAAVLGFRLGVGLVELAPNEKPLVLPCCVEPKLKDIFVEFELNWIGLAFNLI